MIIPLLKYIKEYRRETILAPLCVTGETILDIVIPLLMAKIIDVGIVQLDLHYIYRIGGLLVGATMLSLGLGALAGNFAARASAGFAKNLRQAIYNHIQTFAFAEIDKFSTSGLVTRLTTDITNIQNAFQNCIRGMIRVPLILLFTMLSILNISKAIAGVFLIMIPVIGGSLLLLIYKANPHFWTVLHHYDRLNQVVEENTSAIRVVKSYVQEQHEINKFNQVSQDIYQHFTTAAKIVVNNYPILNFAIYTATILIVLIGTRMIIAGHMTTGELMSIMVYIKQIFMSLMIFSTIFVSLIIADTSLKRATEILQEQSSLQNEAAPITNVADGSIQFQAVSFSYVNDPHKLCLRDLTFSIPAGATIGIIGATGSAKSSLVQLIPRLYDVTSGSILVGGVDVRQYDLQTLRNSVAMVLQNNVLFSGTIHDNLRWGKADATDAELIHACQLAQADSFIRTLPQGYNSKVEQGGVNFSGGQKQRLCIARALLKQPKVLILDDSTSAVDTKTDSLIRQALQECLPNTTKIIIAQRIDSVSNADRILVLDQGTMSGFADSQTLQQTNSLYREIYASQRQLSSTKDDETSSIPLDGQDFNIPLLNQHYSETQALLNPNQQSGPLTPLQPNQLPLELDSGQAIISEKLLATTASTTAVQQHQTVTQLPADNQAAPISNSVQATPAKSTAHSSSASRSTAPSKTPTSHYQLALQTLLDLSQHGSLPVNTSTAAPKAPPKILDQEE